MIFQHTQECGLTRPLILEIVGTYHPTSFKVSREDISAHLLSKKQLSLYTQKCWLIMPLILSILRTRHPASFKVFQDESRLHISSHLLPKRLICRKTLTDRSINFKNRQVTLPCIVQSISSKYRRPSALQNPFNLKTDQTIDLKDC